MNTNNNYKVFKVEFDSLIMNLGFVLSRLCKARIKRKELNFMKQMVIKGNENVADTVNLAYPPSLLLLAM